MFKFKKKHLGNEFFLKQYTVFNHIALLVFFTSNKIRTFQIKQMYLINILFNFSLTYLLLEPRIFMILHKDQFVFTGIRFFTI